MSLNSAHKEIAKRDLNNLKNEWRENVRQQFNKTEQVTIDISLAHIDFLKRSVLDPFIRAVEAEKELESKPATKAYEEISKYSEEELREWLVESVITVYINQFVQNEANKLIYNNKEKENIIIT